MFQGSAHWIGALPMSKTEHDENGTVPVKTGFGEIATFQHGRIVHSAS
jgi:hypothetical protein